MRKNEYNSLEEFTSQYVGEWGPIYNHYFGLDFEYRGQEYRFHTGPMYETTAAILTDGRRALFGLYKRIPDNAEGEICYELLEEFATMEDALRSTCIGGVPFSEVIMDDDTILLGQD